MNFKKMILVSALFVSVSAHAQISNLDSYLGSYNDVNSTGTGDLPYAIFFKEQVVLKDTQKALSHYIFMRSRVKLTDAEQAKSEKSWATFHVSDFYIDESGKYFQFYSFSSYKSPDQLTDIDTQPARQGYACEWRALDQSDPSTLSLDYCGDSAPKDVFTFKNGQIEIKQRDKVDAGIFQFPKTVFDQTYVKNTD